MTEIATILLIILTFGMVIGFVGGYILAKGEDV